MLPRSGTRRSRRSTGNRVDLEIAAADRRSRRVGVVAREDERACIDLGQCAWSRNHAGNRESVGICHVNRAAAGAEGNWSVGAILTQRECRQWPATCRRRWSGWARSYRLRGCQLS